jgi:hypothetical protein
VDLEEECVCLLEVSRSEANASAGTSTEKRPLASGQYHHLNGILLSPNPERPNLRPMVSKSSYPLNRQWRPIGLSDVKDPTLSRQSAHS